MKLAHFVVLRVFSKETDNHVVVAQKLADLVPLDLEKEKINMQKTIATGFNDEKIRIFKIELKKDRHVNEFLRFLQEKLDKEQKEMLLRQAESRLDEDLNFFIRFDKDKWLDSDQLWITDTGNCFHIKISIAAYPAKREKGMEILNELFKV